MTSLICRQKLELEKAEMLCMCLLWFSSFWHRLDKVQWLKSHRAKLSHVQDRVACLLQGITVFELDHSTVLCWVNSQDRYE